MVVRSKRPQAIAGQTIPVPAPFRGLNTREAFTSLGPDEARELENWFPDDGSCRVRPGYTAHSLIAGGDPVQTLSRFSSGSANVLVAAAGGELYDVTTDTPSALTTANYSVNYWSTVQHNGYLFGVNGTDTPWRFNGSAVSATGFTGPTLTTLKSVRAVRNRLWVTVNNSADVYYGGLYAVTGALTVFQLSQVVNGGSCLGVFPWKDFTVFAMSTGQVLVYQGDPASDFDDVGKFSAPPVVAHDAAVEMGSELVLLTTSGPISMDLISAGLAFNLDALGNWGKIAPSWKRDYALYKANSKWFGKFIDGIVYFNVPIGASVSKQYVYNTRTQAWTTYTGLPLASIEHLNGATYIGSCADGNVYRHATGADDGVQIVTIGRPGFSYLGDASHSKQISQIRPNMTYDGAVSAQLQVDTDFVSQPITAPVERLALAGGTTPWGSAWGSPWASTPTPIPTWHGVNAFGYAASPVIRTMSTADNVAWYSTDLYGTPGAQP